MQLQKEENQKKFFPLRNIQFDEEDIIDFNLYDKYRYRPHRFNYHFNHRFRPLHYFNPYSDEMTYEQLLSLENRIGNVNVGFKQKDINKLGSLVYVKNNNNNKDNNNDNNNNNNNNNNNDNNNNNNNNNIIIMIIMI